MKRAYLAAGAGAVLCVAAGAGLYFSLALSGTLKEERERFASASEDASRTIAALEARLIEAVEENERLSDALRAEQRRNEGFEDQLSDLSGTVGVLEKLAKTDPELLAKYSKVYFLNENYSPPSLSPVPAEYAFEEGRTYEVHAAVRPFLEDLLEAAEEDGLSLRVASAYRSFGAQAALKSGYRVTYGSGANTFSADQGYSEHQLGTTVDFTTPAIGGTFAGFDRTDEYAWLAENAWRYGFVLSYPPDNAYYQYEPWHWRFVGEELAERLHDEKRWFYDLDQRAIDEYLAAIFDRGPE